MKVELDSAACGDELNRLNWALRAYVECVSMLARPASPDELMSLACRSIVAQGGYVLALVGMAENSPGKPVRIVAGAGPAAAYADGLDLSWAEDTPIGAGPTGLAIRSGTSHVIGDALIDPAYAHWRDRGARYGIRSTVDVPLRKDGEVIGALVIHASQPNAFGSQELNIFERLVDQLAGALSAEEARQRLEAADAARRQAEDAVRRERDFSDAVIRSLPGVLYIFDQQGRFLRWNDNFERVVGRTSSEVSKMNPTDFFGNEDKERVKLAIDEVFLHGSSTVEADFITKDGAKIPYYFTGVADMIGDSRCLVGVGIDLSERRKGETARRESEARYRALFDYAPDGILVADTEGRYLDANPSICRMLGYEPDELIGLDATSIVAEAEFEHVGQALHAIKTTASYHAEWVFRRKDGSTFPAEVVATIMPYGAILAMVRDTAERHRAETRRRETESAVRDMQGQLARVGRLSMLGEFAATIAHEVNQPLAAITANCDASLRWLAARPPNLDRAREAMGRIIRDSNRAHEVIKHTRAFTLRGEPDFSDIDLNDTIQDIILMTGEEQHKSHVTIVQELCPDLPIVRGDCIELQQVVLNLFLNSIEAMQAIAERDRVITVRTDIESAGWVRVSVQDTGAGFDPNTSERMFEHLFTTKAGGTGLGLRISKSIIEAHGGRLWATRLEPHGALFQFTVPVAADETAKDVTHE
ncbi:MAG TPA: PAS domain S-box protein [Caulobacteraceae bacterium]|nr:PAS domain S-box protein [Caulobacteraceae bacterium]